MWLLSCVHGAHCFGGIVCVIYKHVVNLLNWNSCKRSSNPHELLIADPIYGSWHFLSDYYSWSWLIQLYFFLSVDMIHLEVKEVTHT